MLSTKKKWELVGKIIKLYYYSPQFERWQNVTLTRGSERERERGREREQERERAREGAGGKESERERGSKREREREGLSQQRAKSEHLFLSVSLSIQSLSNKLATWRPCKLLVQWTLSQCMNRQTKARKGISERGKGKGQMNKMGT